jgi:hypothetical protein
MGALRALSIQIRLRVALRRFPSPRLDCHGYLLKWILREGTRSEIHNPA